MWHIISEILYCLAIYLVVLGVLVEFGPKERD